jgi:hypothetical protein
MMQLGLVLVLVLGSYVKGDWLKTFYYSYVADILIPLGFYFLLTLAEEKRGVLEGWWVKALIVFGLCMVSETLQGFGIYALARVFDPVDYVMYGIGVGLAVVVDRRVFTQLFAFWG